MSKQTFQAQSWWVYVYLTGKDKPYTFKSFKQKYNDLKVLVELLLYSPTVEKIEVHGTKDTEIWRKFDLKTEEF